MAATAKIVSELETSALLIPAMAILRSGESNTVFVALEGGKFAPRTVTLGPRSDGDEYQVLSGLSEGERIVTSGQFLLDSESQLREAIQKMVRPGPFSAPAPRSGPDGSSTTVVANPSPSAPPAPLKYICPEPEHVGIQYGQPGVCALCGTTLVGLSPAALRKVQPGGEIIYYTCPTQEHNDVRADQPGHCSKCGLALIPVMEAPPLMDSDTDIGHPGHNH